MEITRPTTTGSASTCEFVKPFTSRNTIDFVLAPEGDGTRVTWTMTGPRTSP